MGRENRLCDALATYHKGVVPKPANKVGTIKISNHAKQRILQLLQWDRLGVPNFPQSVFHKRIVGDLLLSDDVVLLLLKPGATGEADLRSLDS